MSNSVGCQLGTIVCLSTQTNRETETNCAIRKVANYDAIDILEPDCGTGCDETATARLDLQ